MRPAHKIPITITDVVKTTDRAVLVIIDGSRRAVWLPRRVIDVVARGVILVPECYLTRDGKEPVNEP